MVTFLKARSAPSSVSSASASRDASKKRLYCAGSSGLRSSFCGTGNLAWSHGDDMPPSELSHFRSKVLLPLRASASKGSLRGENEQISISPVRLLIRHTIGFPAVFVTAAISYPPRNWAAKMEAPIINAPTMIASWFVIGGKSHECRAVRTVARVLGVTPYREPYTRRCVASASANSAAASGDSERIADRPSSKCASMWKGMVLMGPLSGFGPLVIGPNFIIGPMTSLGNIIVAPDSVGTCQDSEGGDDRHWSSPLLNGSLPATTALQRIQKRLLR